MTANDYIAAGVFREGFVKDGRIATAIETGRGGGVYRREWYSFPELSGEEKDSIGKEIAEANGADAANCNWASKYGVIGHPNQPPRNKRLKAAAATLRWGSLTPRPAATE